MSKINVKVVIGANYGDEGKGLTTNYFSENSNGKCLNVLFNGGCQRGHTVEFQNGVRHVFHHFGAGTYSGADTYFGKDFMVNPIFFVKEIDEFDEMPKCYISPDCRVSTPYDAFINQIVESNRGKERHGSCGYGIWETQQRYENSRYNLKFLDLILLSDDKILEYLRNIARYYLPVKLKEYGIETIPEDYIYLIDSCSLAKHYVRDLRIMQSMVKRAEFNDIAANYDTIVFEGAQGLALSENNIDSYPYVTASNTTSVTPIRMIKDLDCNIEVCYVTRSYFTRHGAGPLPTSCDKDSINPSIEDKTNVYNQFQESIRYGYFDSNNFIHRVLQDSMFYKMFNPENFVMSLMVTHLNYTNDICGNITLSELAKWFNNVYVSYSKFSNEVKRLEV